MTDDLVKRLREGTDWYKGDCEIRMEAAARIDALEKALRSLIKMKDEYSPFGGEIYWDRVDRAWTAARAALGEKKE